MAIEDTGLLNSSLDLIDKTAVKNEGKTTIEKNTAGIVTDQQRYNQREAKNLKFDGFSKVEIDTYHNTPSFFPKIDAFEFGQSDLKINNITQDDANGLTPNEIIQKNIDNDVENYKNYAASLENRNKKFHEINQKILENPEISQQGMLDALGIKNKIKYIQQDGYDKEMDLFLNNIYYGTVDSQKYMNLINQIGFIMSENVNKISKDGNARGLYMFDGQDNSIEEAFEYYKYLMGGSTKSFANRVKTGNANYLNTVQQMKLIASVIKQKIPESLLKDALDGNSDAFVSIMKTIYGKKYTEELQNKTTEVIELSKNSENIDYGDMDIPTFLYRGEGWLNNLLEDAGFDYGSVSHFHKNIGRTQIGKLSLAQHAIDTGGLSVSEYNMMIHELAQLERNFLQLLSDEVTVFTGDSPIYMGTGSLAAAIHKRISKGGHGFLRKYISQGTEQNLLRHSISFSSVSFMDQIIDELINEGYYDDESLSEVMANPKSRHQMLIKMWEILSRPEFWKNQGFAAGKGVAMSVAARAMFKRIYPDAKSLVKYDKNKIGSKDKTTIEYENFKFTGAKRTYREADDAITYGQGRLFRDELPLAQRFPFLGPNVSNFTGQILGLSSSDYITAAVEGQPMNFRDAAAKNLAFLFTVNVLSKGGKALYNRMRRKNTYDPEYGDPAHPENRYIEFGFEPPSAKAKEVYINMSKRDLKIQEIKERKLNVNEKVINLPESKVVDTKIIDDIEIAEVEINSSNMFGKENMIVVDLVQNLTKPNISPYQINKNADGTTTIKDGLHLELSIHSATDENGNIINFTVEKENYEDNNISPFSRKSQNLEQEFTAEAEDFIKAADESFAATTDVQFKDNVEYAKVSDNIKQRFREASDKITKDAIDEYRRLIELSDQSVSKNLTVESGFFPVIDFYLTESTIFGKMDNANDHYKTINELMENSFNEYFIQYITTINLEQMAGGKIHIYEIDGFDYAFPAEILNKLIVQANRNIKKYKQPIELEVFFKYKNDDTAKEDIMRLKSSEVGYLVITAKNTNDRTKPALPIAYIKPLDIMDSFRNEMMAVKNALRQSTIEKINAAKQNIIMPNIDAQNQTAPFQGGEPNQKIYDSFWDGRFIGLDFIDAIVLNAALHGSNPIKFEIMSRPGSKKGEYANAQVWVGIWKSARLADIRQQTRTAFHEIFHFEDHQNKLGELDDFWNVNKDLWEQLKEYLPEAAGGTGGSQYSHYGPGFNIDPELIDAAIKKWKDVNLSFKDVGRLGRGDLVGAILKSKNYIATEFLDKDGNPVTFDLDVEIKLQQQAEELAKLEESKFEEKWSDMGLAVTAQTIVDIVNKTGARENTPPAVYEEFTKAPQHIKKRILVQAMKGLIDQYMQDVVDVVNDGMSKPMFDFTKEQQRIFAELLQQYMNEHGLIKKQILMQEAMAISLAARPFPVHFIEVVKELTTKFGELKPMLVEKLTKDGKPIVWTAQEYMHLVDPSYWTDARIDALRERTRLYRYSYENQKEVEIDRQYKTVSFEDLRAYYNSLNKYEVVWSSHLADFLRNYRGSTVEVYADVMSYMMVNPEQAAILGPNIVHLMEQHLSERPKFKEFFEDVVASINKGPDERMEQAYEFAAKESENQVVKFAAKVKEIFGGGLKAGFFNGESMLLFKVLFDDYMAGASIYVDNNVMRPPDIYGNQGIEFFNPLTGQYEDLNKAEYIQFLQDNIRNFDTVSDNFKSVFYTKYFQPLMQVMKDKGVSKGKVNAYITFKSIAENVYITGEHLTPYQIIKESGYTIEDFIEAFGKDIFEDGGKTQASLRSAENLVAYFEKTQPEITQILDGIFGQNGLVKLFFKKHMATSQLFGAKELDKIFANPWYITMMNFEYLMADMEAGNHPFRMSKAFKKKKGGSIDMPFEPLLTTIWKVQMLAMAEQENAYKIALFSEKSFDGKYMAERADNAEDKKFYEARHGQKGLFAETNWISKQYVDPKTGTPIEIDAQPGTIEYAMQMLSGTLVGGTYKDHYQTIELLAGDVFPWLSTMPKIVGDVAETIFGKVADITHVESLAKFGKDIKKVLDITGKPRGFWDITPESAHKQYGELLNNYRKEYEAADGDPYLIEIAQRAFKKYHEELLKNYMPAPTTEIGANFWNKDKITGGPMVSRKRQVIGEEVVIVGNISKQRYLELPKNRRQVLDEVDKKTGEQIYQEIKTKLIYEKPKKGEKLMTWMEQPNYTEKIKGVLVDLGVTNREADSERQYLIVNEKMEFTTWKRGGQYNFALHPELQKAFLVLAQWQKSIYTTLSPMFILPNQIIDLWTASQNVKMNLIFPEIYTQEYEIAGVKFKLPKGFKDNSTSLMMYWIQSMKKSKNQIFTDELLNIEKGLFAEGIVLPRSKRDIGIVEISKSVEEGWGEEYLQLQQELDSIHELVPRLSKDDALQQWREHPAHFMYESAKNIVNGQIDLAKFSELSTRQALYDGLVRDRSFGLNNFSDKQIAQIVRRRIVNFKVQAPGLQQLEIKWPFLNVLHNLANAQNTAYDAFAYLGYNEKTGKYGTAFHNNHYVRSTVGLGMAFAIYEMLEDYEFLGERTALCKQYTKKWDRDNYLTLPHLLCNSENGQISTVYTKIPLNTPLKISKKIGRTTFEPLFRQLRTSLDGEDKDPSRFDYLKTRAEEKFSILANDLPSGTGPLSLMFDIIGLVNPSHNPKSGLTGQNYVKNDLMMAAQGSKYTAWQDKQLIHHAGLGGVTRLTTSEDPYFELLRAKLAALSENYANPFHYDWDINNEGVQSRNLDTFYIGNFGLIAGVLKRFVTKSYDNQAVFAESKKIKQENAAKSYSKKSLTTRFVHEGWETFTPKEQAQFYIEFGERTRNKQSQILYWKQFKNTASRTYMMMINAGSQEEFYRLAKILNQAQRGIVGNSGKENAIIDNAQNILISPKQKIRIKKKDE